MAGYCGINAKLLCLPLGLTKYSTLKAYGTVDIQL